MTDGALTEAERRRSTPKWSWRIATVAGIEIRVHVSFGVLIALFALASRAPEGPPFLDSMAWVAALFACVVVHELSHSLVARRHGIIVREIDLLPIGGVSRLERDPTDPTVELKIAAAGPAASVAVAAVLFVLAAVSGTTLWPPAISVGSLLPRLAWVNLLLAGFNLLPAFPLDGGRILRAALGLRMDRNAATHLAAHLGRWLAMAMIAVGFAFNLWLMVIGVFVFVGGLAEEGAVALHEAVGGVLVRDVMIREPIVLHVGSPAGEAAHRLAWTAQREFPVCDGAGALVGIVTAAQLRSAPSGAPVGHLAERAAVLDATEPLETAGLLQRHPTVAVVLDGGSVVGLARADDAAAIAQLRLSRASAPASAP
jgi:stage IV sporulation protein FB